MNNTFKKIFTGLSLIFLFALNGAIAQEVKWDSTYRPGSYLKKVEAFKNEGINKNDLVF